jgi:hypothetical protein
MRRRLGAGQYPGLADQSRRRPVPTSVCAAQNGQLAGFNGKLNIGANDGKANYNAIYLTVDKPYSKASGWGFTVSATWQRARPTWHRTRRGRVLRGPSQTQFGWENVQGVDKYRVVATGIVGLPFDIRFSAPAPSLGPGIRLRDFRPPNVPDGACCVANLGGVRFRPRPSPIQECRSAHRQDVRPALGHFGHGGCAGLQRLRLGQPQLFRMGRRQQSGPEYRERHGRQRPQLPGRRGL